ncbi:MULTISPECIES: hypothetical protein [unclassified Pseudoalteromonas]|uniref:hypothetical protein n=1 Tax=unclassified Pseudoalteromonas TaxID=194690 RepID=UPI00301437E4
MAQRTMKHSDWLKVVESRTKTKPSKTPSKPVKHYKLLVLTLIFTCIGVVASQYNNTESVNVKGLDAAAEQRIYRYFSKQYMMGSWQFSHLKTSTSEVNVYIRIPERLALQGEALNGYISQSLCPPSNSAIWHDVGSLTVFIHLYSESPRRSDFAACRPKEQTLLSGA